MAFTPTPEQRAIIDYPAMPLRVAAGAGTGKTTTIVLRLAALVRNGLSPEKAIGITFTNKAADELASRLREALPELADEGREVEVTTYHGFAFGILQEFGAMIGIERDSEIIGNGYVRQLMQDAIAMGSYPTLDLTAVAQRVDEAVDLASQLSRNLCEPESLVAITGEDMVAQRRADLAAVLVRYTALKRDLGVLDYGDLILLTHRLLRDHPTLAHRIRSRYSAALLDEYQDTDPAQRELLRALFGDGFPVTAVGDPDQTIYEWRGASTENFESFPVHFPTKDGVPAETLPLTENRRSKKTVLDVAHAIRVTMNKGVDFPRLRPVAGALPGEVSVDYYRTAVDEAEAIAQEINRLHDEESTDWRDIAVIFRKNKDMALVRDALQAQQIPVEVGSLGGLLDLPDVADLHAWLRVIERPGDSVALARILLGPGYRLGLRDIAALTNWIRPNRTQLGEDPDAGWPLVEAVDQLEDVSDLSEEARSRLTRFRGQYRSLLRIGQESSLVDLCRRILDETGTWSEIEARDRGSALTARVNLYRFLDLAEQWSPLQGRPTLQAFLGYLDLIADDKSAAELDTANVGAEDAVVLLTIHRAKGLEWDTVFIPALTRGVFPTTGGALDDPAQLARFLPYDLRLEPPVPAELDGEDRRSALRLVRDRQEWRAAYVGITRARTRLYLSGAYWHGSARNPRDPSPLLEAAAEIVEIKAVTEAGERPDSLAVVPNLGAPDPLFPDGWRTALRRALAEPAEVNDFGIDPAYDAAVEQIRLTLDDMPAEPPDEPSLRVADTSVTGLVTFAQCPQRFYWTEVDPLPRRPTTALRRGVKVHRLIELHGRGQMPLDDLDHGLYDVPDADDSSTDVSRGATGPYQLYLGSRFALTKPRFIETAIDLRLSTGRIRGRIDAIYEDDVGWEIVDFKSGRRKENPAAIVQLEAYAVAAASGMLSPDTPTRMRVTFAYLGGGGIEEEVHEVDTEWIEAAEAHLTDLIARTTGPDYPQSPSPACESCDFLRFCEAGKRYAAGH